MSLLSGPIYLRDGAVTFVFFALITVPENAHRMKVRVQEIDSSALLECRNSDFSDCLGTIPQYGRIRKKDSRFLDSQLYRISK